MAIKFEKIKAGDVLYDCHRQKMGNTTMSQLGCWPVYIISVNAEEKTAQVKWNGNSEQTYYRSQLERLRAKPAKGAE